jgi:acetyl esterase/lipase
MARLLASASFLLVVVSLAAPCQAAGPDPIPLWPQGAPAAKGTEPADVPMIRVYPADPAQATGCCVVVLPGGGYARLATDHEGHQVATWLNSIGVTAAVVTYRLAPYRHPVPLQDAQRGIRYIRAHAEELKVDPHRVGIMGFSAGGHLASTVSTHFDAGDPDNSDPVAKQSSRPDFSILGYPVINLKESFTHGGSRKNLLGDNPDPALVENLSNDLQVTRETPPTFIFHTSEDKAVPVENALVYFSALRKNGVPAEMHIYQKGPHGVGLAPGDPILKTWKDRLADWLKTNGFLNPAPRAAATGTINVHGTPLRWGSVTFVPESPTGPAVCAMVSSGKFAFDQAGGPVIGPNRVTVYSLGAVEIYPTQEAAQVVLGGEQGLVLNVAASGNAFTLEAP